MVNPVPQEIIQMFTNISQCLTTNTRLCHEMYPERPAEVIEVSGKKRKRGKNKDSGDSGVPKKKKGISGYLMFTGVERGALPPTMAPTAKMAELGRRWQLLTLEQRTEWQSKALAHNEEQGILSSAAAAAAEKAAATGEEATAAKKAKKKKEKEAAAAPAPADALALVPAPAPAPSSAEDEDEAERQRKKEKKEKKKKKKEAAAAAAAAAAAPPPPAEGEKKKKKKDK